MAKTIIRVPGQFKGVEYGTPLANTSDLYDDSNNQGLNTTLEGKQNTIDASNKLSADFVDDTDTTNKFVTASDKTTWSGKQDALVSGTNIKTINNESILGSGNIEIQGGTDQIQSDWNQANDEEKDYIKNKPSVFNEVVVSITRMEANGVDDLELIAGNNIQLTPNTTNNSVTITSKSDISKVYVGRTVIEADSSHDAIEIEGNGVNINDGPSGYSDAKRKIIIDASDKANKSEMSVTPGTGADTDKTTIQLKQGTSATVLVSHQDISGKQDVINDLSTIRSGAASGATAQQPATTLAGYGITDAYTKSETYSKTEVNGLVSTPHQEYETVEATSQTTAATDVLPASGQAADTIYRVSNWDGSANSGTGAFDVTKYSEYAWDDVSTPNKYVFLCVKSQVGEVFDISVYNNNAKYADLAAALNGGSNIPQFLQKGGMSVKFVQSSDNKYVQYRLTSNTFTTTNSEWQKQGAEVSVSQNTSTGDDSLLAGSTEIGRFADAGKLIELYAIASSRPAGISVGQTYYNTADKTLVQIVDDNPDYVEIPFYKGAIYQYQGKLYIWNGTDLEIVSVNTKANGCIRLVAIAASRPANIQDGEYYWNWTSNTLVQYLNGISVNKETVPNTYYSCNGQLFYYNGTALALLPTNSLNTISASGNDNYAVRTPILLQQGHYYKVSIPQTWSKPSSATYNSIFWIDNPAGNSICDVNGKLIEYSSFDFANSWLFKADTTGVYSVGIRSSNGEIHTICISDITNDVQELLDNSTSLLNKINVGDILSYAPIGSVSPLTVETDNAWRYIDIPVAEGDIYIITGTGGRSSRLWCILDADNIVIDISSDAETAKNKLIYITARAARLIVNFAITYHYYFGKATSQNLNLLYSLNNKLQTELPLNAGTIKCGGAIGNKPTLETDSDSSWRYCNIDVTAGDIFILTGHGGSGIDYPLYSILGADGRIIEVSEQADVANDLVIKIPIDGAKLLCNMAAYYNYKIIGVPNNVADSIIRLVESGYSSSPFYRSLNYGVPPTDDYIGQGTDYTWGADNTQTSEVYDKFDTLINTSTDISDRTIDVDDGYVFRHYIGDACDNQPLCVYEFKPPRAANVAFVTQLDDSPKIFILCGQHGFEKQSTYGIFYLLNDVINNSDKSLIAKYIREFVHLYVVPVANPSGWNIRSYVNGNGVNLNRNWYVNGWVKQTEPESENTGNAPFDQPETAALRDYINTIENILLFMDCHQNGSGLVTYQAVNWIDITRVADDSYYNKVLQVASFEISSNTRLFRNLYQSEIGGTNEMLGYIGNPMPGSKGYADLWAVEQKHIIGITHEGFGGFPLGVVNNPTSHKANSELFGNFIKNFLCYYSR